MPEPALVSATVPEPFWITPEKVESPDVVSVLEPAAPEVSVPLPDKAALAVE